MWTLDDINKFVCSYKTDLECPACERVKKTFKGVVTYVPEFCIFPEYNDATNNMQAKVEIEAKLDRQSCLCKLTGPELARCRQKAINSFYTALYNSSNSAPRTEAEDAAHREEVLAGKAY